MRRFLTQARLACLLLVTVLGLNACSRYPEAGPPMGTQAEIAELEQAILALGPRIDPQEARRAAQTAYSETHNLALKYHVTDPAIIHNMKVNAGLRPRGLCYQWADDMEAAMRREHFKTIALHRAIANADKIRLEHSTLIISQIGDPKEKGIVIDPWREAGILTWKPYAEDTHYEWVDRDKVMAWRKRVKEQGYYSPLKP